MRTGKYGYFIARFECARFQTQPKIAKDTRILVTKGFHGNKRLMIVTDN